MPYCAGTPALYVSRISFLLKKNSRIDGSSARAAAEEHVSSVAERTVAAYVSRHHDTPC